MMDLYVGAYERETPAQARAQGVLGGGNGSQRVHDGLVMRDGDEFVIGRANGRRTGTSQIIKSIIWAVMKR
jgi:hypothetical protein